MQSKTSPSEAALPYEVCLKDELKPGQMRAVHAGRRRLALIRLDDGSYTAISDTCPHEGASLSNGKIEKMWVSDKVRCYETSENRMVAVCPWHNFEFDVVTGNAYAPQRLRVKVYRAEVQGEHVVIYA